MLGASNDAALINTIDVLSCSMRTSIKLRVLLSLSLVWFRAVLPPTELAFHFTTFCVLLALYVLYAKCQVCWQGSRNYFDR